MAKLHELLAVKENLDGQATKCRTELMSTFDKKRHHFEETRTNYTPDTEGAKMVVESHKDIQTTVAKEVEWISRILAKALDINFQIDVANSQAKADVVLENGTVLLKDVPATNLLQLERRMNEIKALVDQIPTLDPAKGFKLDLEKGKGIYKAREISKARTKKENKVLTLYQATKEHPAQTQLVSEDVKVGTIQEQEWSALITPAVKADILERVEEVARAVKRARAKANELDLDVAGNKIGKKMLDYVFEPLEKQPETAVA